MSRLGRAAFTLVELMLVVIIIGVLAATIVPRFAGRAELAKAARAHADLASLGVALDLFELDAGQYPERLEALVASEPRGPYLRHGLPNDPWDHPYVYQRESQHGQDYDLASLGPDGQPGHDDITNWP